MIIEINNINILVKIWIGDLYYLEYFFTIKNCLSLYGSELFSFESNSISILYVASRICFMTTKLIFQSKELWIL